MVAVVVEQVAASARADAGKGYSTTAAPWTLFTTSPAFCFL